ncbi:putative acetyltransferase [Paenibacillus castaneae]|nr:GNAT family N-acetyltransferase [Paenibacillus castaneae]NIK80027.1 putative acetyltransferase [Paenibacillus castaneae]
MNAVLQFINIYIYDGPEIWGFIVFLAGIGSLTILIIIIVELITNKPDKIKVKIVSKYNKSIYVLREDGKIKRYAIVSHDIFENIQTDQLVELTLSQMTRIPLHLNQLNRDAGLYEDRDLQLMVATEQHLEQLALMNKQLIEDEGSLNEMTHSELLLRMQEWLKGDWQIDLLLKDEAVVGYALYRFNEHAIKASNTEIYLRQFFIKRECRNQGLGIAGVQLLLKNRFSSANAIVIDVLESNPKGMNFWKKASFHSYYTNMRLEKKQ